MLLVFITAYCEAMIEDLKAARQLLAAGYKNNILIVRYEDVAVNEETAVENIYKWVLNVIYSDCLSVVSLSLKGFHSG